MLNYIFVFFIERVYLTLIVKENRKYISDKKQITYILTQNGIAIPVHLNFSECRVRILPPPLNAALCHTKVSFL